MTTTLVTGIGQLVTNDPAHRDADGSPLGLIADAAFVVAGRDIAWVGRARDAGDADRRIDVEGAAVLPGFVDSHTHLVFAGDRADEFAARMSGNLYSAGGIVSTVRATRAASDAALRANVGRLMRELAAGGTTTVEIKSGYGLTVDDEARSVAVAREFTSEVTLLGAHVVPPEYAADRGAYVELVCGPMLAACADGVRWVDVFCDVGAFDLVEAKAILTAAAALGKGLRIHAHQLTRTGAIALAVEFGAASADHCNLLDAGDVAALASSDTVATLVPAADFSTRAPYAPARALVDAGSTVALATDCNPGSAYTTSMAFCIALAVRDMGLSPAEAVWAATAGGARALRRTDIGVLQAGRRADFAVLRAPSYVHVAYRPGVALVAQTWRDGERIYRS